MTITPTDPMTPGIAASGCPDGVGDPDAGGGFLAAIVQALTSLGDHPAADAAPADSSGQAVATPDATVDPAAIDPAAIDPAAIDPAAIDLVVPPALAGQLGLAAAAAVASAPAPGHANVASGADLTSAGTIRDIRMSGDAVAAPPGTTTSEGETAAPGPPPAEGALPSAQSPGHLTGDGTASTPAAGPSAPVAQQPVAPVGPITPVVQSVSSAAVVPMPDVADSAPSQPVTRQVFPEVTSMMTRGDGTHRITLTLKPEALGEVRVVMTVRDGSVHVRLAAGHEAQQALRDGSPELTRLLEVAGATESRIVVRDLPATTSGTVTTSTTDLGTGGHRSQDRHAGTRADHPATDGANDKTRVSRGSTGADEARSIKPVTHTRTAGVDVTM